MRALQVKGLRHELPHSISISETTDGAQFDMLLEIIAGLGRSLFSLFQVSSLVLVTD